MKLPALRGLARHFDDVQVVASTTDARTALACDRTFVVVERGVPRVAMFKCPCGCGDVVTLNLDWRVGPAWRLLRADNDVSIRPSVWRDDHCQSHFIVWKSRVLFAASSRRRRRRREQKSL